MIEARLRTTRAAFARVSEKFGESLTGHAARGLRLLEDADAEVTQAHERFKEPHRTSQIARALARAESERSELAGILQNTDTRLQNVEGSVLAYFRQIAPDPVSGALIVQVLQAMDPGKRSHAIRMARDPKIIAAVSMVPAELGIATPDDVQSARSRLWAELNPAKAAEVGQLEHFRGGLSLVINTIDAGLRDLRDSARLQPVAR